MFRTYTLRRIRAIVAIVSILSLTGGLSFGGLTFTPTPAAAATDATIIGKVLKADGTPISFPCMAPPGDPNPPPAGSLCGIGVGAFAGPESPPFFTGVSTTDGTFSLPVEGGKKYKIEFHGPPEAIGQYTIPGIFVDIASGQTKDLGTTSLTAKQGHIRGTVVLSGTSTPVAGVFLSAFPMMPPGGEGQPGPVFPSQATSAADGTFDLLVNAGRYIVNTENRPESQYVTAGGPPTEANVETDTSTVTGLTVSVIKADAEITGRVLDEAGVQVHFPGGVGARAVGATDYSEFNGPIMPPGLYSIKVSSAKATQYTLNVHMPPGAEYSVKGTVTVTVIPNGKVTQDLTLARNTSAIYGKVISDSGFAMSGCKASGDDRFGGKRFGEVFAHSQQSGTFANAPINEDCTFTMSLGAGIYQFGHHLNPQAGFINRPAPPEEITVEANQRVEKNITVLYGDSAINVTVVDPTGKPMPYVHVEANNGRQVEDEFKQGGGPGGPGGGPGGPGGPKGPDDGFRGPGGLTDPQKMMEYCLVAKNKTECQNFKMPPGATGPGGKSNMYDIAVFCRDNRAICEAFDKEGHDQPPQGQGKKIIGASFKSVIAAGQVRILAEDVSKGELKGPDLARDVLRSGGETGPDGKVTINVVGGKQYEVRAFLPPDRNSSGLLPPKAAVADLRTAKSVPIVIQFRTSFGNATGTVTLPGGTPARLCFVHFWSEDGSDGGAPCNPNGSGTFTLGYGQGKLHFSADSFDQAAQKLYRSEEEVVTITNQKTLTKNFALKEATEKLFTPVTKSCDSDESCTVTLDNGGTLTIPAGAAGDNKTLTVTAQPTVNLKKTESFDPGLGYSFEVKDSNGQEVTEFESNVTIKIPYEEPEGLDERFLSAKFVNETTGALDDPTSATQSTQEDTFTVSETHLSDWAVVKPGGKDMKSVTTETSGKNTKVTIGGTKTITLKGGKSSTWNVGTEVFGSKSGQLIVVSSKSKGGKVLVYNTNGKLTKTITPIPGYTGGLNQLLADVTAKSGSTSDSTDDVIVAPAKTGPASAAVLNIKDNKKQLVTTGEGTGVTTLSAPELVTKGVSNLATLFGGKTSKAFQLSGGKLKLATSKSITSLLSVKNGKVEKKVQTPKVKSQVGNCSSSDTKKITLKGSGFNGPVVALWNAETAISATTAANGASMTITINPSVTDVEAINVLTIVNADGQAGVTSIKCRS